ncbi:hypothetical protein T01_11578 [Trichinella spiralis]|uniref:Uncharacterized protein n=1 Tax=Trichinella spiralis TaxID=6334 RepID=A0A0V1B4X8_TRISP|nr:hypothetical protein T01_11578 [Trichinella spiralis]
MKSCTQTKKAEAQAKSLKKDEFTETRQNAKEWAVNANAKARKAEEERKRPKKKQENFIEEMKSCTQTKKAEEQAKSLKKDEFIEA